MPRWLWVAIGTTSITRSISSSSNPCPASRSRASSATISCAHGQAVIPWAWTPRSIRNPRSDTTAVPNSVYISCVRLPDSGVTTVSG